MCRSLPLTATAFARIFLFMYGHVFASILLLISTSTFFGASFTVLPSHAQSIPESLLPGLQVRPAGTSAGGAVRMAHDPTCGCLYVLTINGGIYRHTSPSPVLEYSDGDHGLNSQVLGMDIGPDGTLYLVGNNRDGDFTEGIIVRGVPVDGEERRWSTVARTVPYPRSNTPFDHTLNGIAVSPDGGTLYVNSGSRTDHGEIQDAEGRFPGLREVPLTSAILRIPANADSVTLPNDAALLQQNGTLFADGTRNSFDLAFDAEGRLFATENAGDRDDNEELNWIREGRHYGFPWRIGTNENPQQYSDYDPDADLLLNPESFAVQNGFFYNDPTFPPQPEGSVLTDPIRNTGPDATLYRDPVDGSIRSAADLATFTSHRSPLGLVFDVARALPAPYAGDAFVLSWTGQESALLAPFEDEGEDLLHLELEQHDDTFELAARRLVRGFVNPIDAVLVGGSLFVLEFDGEGTIWEVLFDTDIAVEDEQPAETFRLDVFPHPMADRLEVRLMLDRTQRVVIDVYNAHGRRMEAIFAGIVGNGAEQAFHPDISNLAAGVYFVRVVGESFSTARAVVKIR